MKTLILKMRRNRMKEIKSLTESLESGDDKADLTPLIDCVFLLLLFFIVTSTFSEETTLFEIKIPKAKHAEVKKVKDVVSVAISKNGQLSLGNEYVPDDQLYTKLSSLHKTTPITTFIIKGDKDCPYEKVIMAMDIAQALDIDEISLAVGGE